MTLKLTIIHTEHPLAGQEMTHIVSPGGLSIGRSPAQSQWVLADPKRRLSRLHCRIDYQNGDYFIVDCGSGNGVYLNHGRQRLEAERPVPLGDGDVIALCDPPVYEIRADLMATERTDPQPKNPNAWWKEETPPPSSTPPPTKAKTQDEWWRDDPPPASPPPPAPPPEPPRVQDLGPAMQAFLQGAGLTGLAIDPRDAPQVLERLGALLRETVRGVLDLLQARNEVRTGFNIPSHTQVRATNNNPFKSLTVSKAGPRSREEQVLGLLLGGPDPAYLPPVQALQQAFDDVRAHELAVMAGMEAAIAQLLERFRPDNLKARIDQGSVLDNVLPGGRKARYWEEFQRLYEEIVQEARDDSQKLFEGEFERAYEAQVQKLAQRSEHNP